MKKLFFYTIMLLIFVSAAGCSKKDIEITAEDISVNTILAKADGRLQVATVENFDKPYYTLAELEDFAANEINLYNQTAGGEKITKDNVLINNEKNLAVMLLSYTGMDQYCAFNQVTAAYFNGGNKEIPFEMPATLLSSKDGKEASTLEVIQNEKYKVLVMNEPYDILVDGSVKYYSANANYVDKNKVQSAAEGMTIVVFKP
jgi:hypothetical protein